MIAFKGNERLSLHIQPLLRATLKPLRRFLSLSLFFLLIQPQAWLSKLITAGFMHILQPTHDRKKRTYQKAGITGFTIFFLISECNLNHDCGNMHSSFYNKLQSTSVLTMWQHMVHKDCCPCARLPVCTSHAITSDPFVCDVSVHEKIGIATLH